MTDDIATDTDMCHNGHPFQPGRDVDMDTEGRKPDNRWCHVCGETRGWLVGPSSERKRRAGEQHG